MRFRLGIVLALVMTVGGVSAAFATEDEMQTMDGGKKVIVVTATTVEDTDLDFGEEGFGQGDRTVFAEDLFRNGRKVGETGAECIIVRLIDEESATVNCIGTLSLPQGQLTVQGLVTFTEEDRPFTVAITGGTGLFRKARGELTVQTISETEDRYIISVFLS
jgi:hypothetical protein